MKFYPIYGFELRKVTLVEKCDFLFLLGVYYTEDMKDPDVTDWVALWIEGNREAFEMLVRLHSDAVYNLAYQMCGNAATAEDIAQETFIRAYQRSRQYKPAYSFRNWVLGICANLCRSRYRSWRRKHKMEQAYAEEQARQRKRMEWPDERSNDHLALENALRELPATLRAPIVLQSMEGMSLQEIADTLHIGVSAAKMRIARGRQQLRRMLETPAGKS